MPRLRDAGVRFIHGDVASRTTCAPPGAFDALVECSAEPSVMAGTDGATGFVVRTNLLGAYHCLEEAARHGAQVVFLSTSRVYPVAALNGLAYVEGDTRFHLADTQPVAGASVEGVAEEFPLEGPRTLYVPTKLAAELLVSEYAESFGLETVVDRCGVVAGPWQMGKVDQGVFTHWMAPPTSAGSWRTSASAAQGSRSATCCTSSTWWIWSTTSSRVRGTGPGRL